MCPKKTTFVVPWPNLERKFNRCFYVELEVFYVYIIFTFLLYDTRSGSDTTRPTERCKKSYWGVSGEETMSLNVWQCHTLSTVSRPTTPLSPRVTYSLLCPGSLDWWWKGHVGDQRWVHRGLPTMAGCRCLWLSVGCARSLTELLLLLRLRFAAWHSVSVDNSWCPRLEGGRHAQHTVDMPYWHAEWLCCHSHCCWPACTAPGLLCCTFLITDFSNIRNIFTYRPVPENWPR